MATKGDQYSTHTGNIWNYAHRGDITGVEQALERGVDVNIANKAGWTPALAACAGGQTKLLQVLLHRGADLAAVDNAGRTVVHEAARNGELEVLKLLRKEGCDFGAKANNGQSAMDVAKGEATR